MNEDFCFNCAKRFAEGFLKGRQSVFRKNTSGCTCIIDDNDNIIQVCGAHQELIEKALMKGGEYIEYNFKIFIVMEKN